MADDTTEHVTIREFSVFKDAVVDAISESSSGVHKRLDRIEQRFDTRFDNVQRTTNDLLRISGEHASKLGDHERRLGANGHKHIRKDDPPSPDNEPLTMKDLKRAAWVAAAAIAVALAGAVLVMASVLEKTP